MIKAFTFEAVKEAFRHSIVVAISYATHTDQHAVLLQEHEIAFARIGTATSLRDGVTPLVDSGEPEPFLVRLSLIHI